MKKEMWHINSFNFLLRRKPNAVSNVEVAKNDIDLMIKKCNINTVNIAIMASQEHCFSTHIDYTNNSIFKDQELVELIAYCKEKGLKVILKPMINPTDGYWRAYIRFFDKDVPGEPTWNQWFESNTNYLSHYAKLAEENSVDMIIIGCELVGTDHRSENWRKLISDIRSIYSGLLTYNCDKYQEDNINWWDALDVISSSGYYPIDEWDQELSRIEKVVTSFNKPFFFSECGCPSTENSCYRPNDWTKIHNGTKDLDMQKQYFDKMFKKCIDYKWHKGYSIWSWSIDQINIPDEKGYSVLDKPAEVVIYDYFSSQNK